MYCICIHLPTSQPKGAAVCRSWLALVSCSWFCWLGKVWPPGTTEKERSIESASDVAGLSLWCWFTGITRARWCLWAEHLQHNRTSGFLSPRTGFSSLELYLPNIHYTDEISLSYHRKWNETLVAVYCILKVGWLFVPLSFPLQQQFNSINDLFL